MLKLWRKTVSITEKICKFFMLLREGEKQMAYIFAQHQTRWWQKYNVGEESMAPLKYSKEKDHCVEGESIRCYVGTIAGLVKPALKGNTEFGIFQGEIEVVLVEARGRLRYLNNVPEWRLSLCTL